METEEGKGEDNVEAGGDVEEGDEVGLESIEVVVESRSSPKK